MGPGEGCDDGNAVDDDECNNDCMLPTCGDAAVAERLRIADGDPVERGQQLLAGQLDPRVAAPLVPNALPWWMRMGSMLEVVRAAVLTAPHDPWG